MSAGARVLLLGAAGFLGRAVGDVLESDTRVSSIVRLGSRVRSAAAGSWVTHDLVRGTDADLEHLLRSIAPDAVVNCVGKLAGPERTLVEANVLVPARLVDAVTAAAPRARLVTIGSAAEYGVVPRGTPVAEDASPEPVGTYGVTKLAATRLVRLAVEAGRLDAVVLRVFNPVGPQVPDENLLGRAAASIRAAMATGEDVVRFGPLGSYRDFVDVRDVAVAVAAAALAPLVGEPVLNVGSGTAVTARHAVERLVDVSGFRGRVEESAPAPSRSAAVDWIAADTRRIRSCLGWQPVHDLDTSVKAVWAA